MIVRLNMLDASGNETANNFIFKDGIQFLNDHEYKHFLSMCYTCFVNTNLIFHASSFAGFNTNLSVSSNTTVGVGESGSLWQGNYLGPKLLTINFDNVYDYKKGEMPFSPNELLASFINNPNQFVLVGVMQQDKEYTMICYYDNNTATENGTLSLVSAFPNEGCYWNGGELINQWYFWQERPTTPRNLPSVLLDNNWYPFKKQIISVVEQRTYLKIGGGMNGKWNKIKLTFNNQILEYSKDARIHDYIIFDSENETIKDEGGNDLSAFVTIIQGDSKLINTIVGINMLEIVVDDILDVDLFEDLPTDFMAEMRYNDYKSSINMGAIC